MSNVVVSTLLFTAPDPPEKARSWVPARHARCLCSRFGKADAACSNIVHSTSCDGEVPQQSLTRFEIPAFTWSNKRCRIGHMLPRTSEKSNPGVRESERAMMELCSRSSTGEASIVAKTQLHFFGAQLGSHAKNCSSTQKG